MNQVLLILCHPNPKSLSHAVAEAVAARLRESGRSVLFHDLYGEGFDPVLSRGELSRRFSFDELVQQHYRELESADGLVVVHPEWWSGPPAMLKGWVDRVLRPGIGYEFEGEEFMEKSKVPLLSGKQALVLATTDADPPEARSAGEPPGEPLLAAVWRETFSYCGILDYQFRMLYRMRTTDSVERRGWLAASSQFARTFFA